MQTDPSLLYKMTAQRTGKSEEKYKEIGSFVFKALAENIRRPKSLIIKLKGIGYWYLRKNRVEKTLELFPPDFENRPPDGEEWYHKLKVLQYENKIEIHEIFKERLKDYQEYLAEKARVRQIRNKTQKLIEPPNDED